MGKIKKTPTERHTATASPATIDFVTQACSTPLHKLIDKLSQFPLYWPQPRGDLYHWIPLLDRFDGIFELFNREYALDQGPQMQPFERRVLQKGDKMHGIQSDEASEQELEALGYPPDGDRVLIEQVLRFTRVLLERCGNRSLYASSEHLDHLLNTTSLSLLKTCLQLTLRLAQRYQVARFKNGQSHAQATLLSNHYNISLDHMHKLALPVPQPRLIVQQASQTPSRTQQKAVDASVFNPADLMALLENEFPLQLRKELSTVVVSYANAEKTQRTDSVTPSTPTPVRQHSNTLDTPRRDSPAVNVDTPSKNRDSYFPAPTTKTFDISSDVVIGTDSFRLVQDSLQQVPKEQHFELLQRIRVAKAFASSDDSLRTIVEIRLLAISNLAYALSESNFQHRIGISDSNESRRYHLATQLCDLLQPLHNGQRFLALPAETIVLETLEALARCKPKSAEVVDALAVSVNHGVLYYMLRQAISSLKVDDEGEEITLQRIHWRHAIFELVTNVSHITSHVKCAEKMVAAGIIDILVEALTFRTSSAERVYEKVMGFLTSFVHGIPTAFQALVSARGFEIIPELASQQVTIAMQRESEGKGMPESLRSKVIDYTIPYYQQATLRSVFKFVSNIFEHHSGHNERLLRNLLDSPYTLGALRQIVCNANRFGSMVWESAINTISIFMNSEPTSFQVIAEAGLAKGILEAITQKPLPDTNLEHRAPQVYDPAVDDIQVLDGIVQLPTVPGILQTEDVILHIPDVFHAICLNEEGMNMFLASGAIEAYLDMFLSPAHVRTIDEESSTAHTIGNAFDELSRHHPALQEQILAAVLRLLRRVHSLAEIPESKATAILQKQAPTPTEHDHGLRNRAPALLIIFNFMKFLEGFLANSSMCQKFCQAGSAALVLDLITSPATPYDLSVFHVLGKVVLVFCRMAEEKGHLVLPELLARLRSSVDSIRDFTNTAGPNAFKQFVDAERLPQLDLPDGLANAFSNVSVISLVMARVLHVSQFANRNGNHNQLLVSMNFTDVFSSLIEELGALHTTALREGSTILAHAPPAWKPFSEFEGGNVRSLDNDGYIHTNSHCAHCGYLGMEGHAAFLQSFKEDNGSTKLAAFRNLRLLRFVFAQVPSNIDLFFASICQLIAHKRLNDAQQKRQAHLIARVVAATTVQWFEHPTMATPDSNLIGELKCTSENLAGLMKIYLKPAQNAESFGARDICALALLKFYNADGFVTLRACQTRLVEILTSDAGNDKDIRTSAMATLDNLLLLLTRLCASKTVNDSSQSQLITQRLHDSIDYFQPNQFLVELRYTILNAVMPLWNSDKLTHVGATSMKWIIEAMREIFKAEGEDKALRRSENIKRADQMRIENYFRIPANKDDVMAALTAKGFDQTLAAEACSRCNNNLDNATEYAQLRLDHGGPRFPVSDLEQYFKAAVTGHQVASTTLQPIETITARDHNMDDSDSDDENMGTLGRLPMDMTQQNVMDLAEADGFRTTDFFPSTPSKAARKPYITIDDLNDERQKLRENLIDRCLEVLSTESDITFDLAHLIQAAVSRSGESANPRADWGSTLVSSLISLQAEESSESNGKKIAAYAHLVALVLQDRDFFDSTLDELKDNFDALLTWIQLGSEQNSENAPRVEMILLIIEQILAEDEQPLQVAWHPPPSDDPLAALPEIQVPEAVVSENTREALFDAVIDLLPKIGKQDTLALSVTRVLVILTRRQALAKRLADKLLMSRLFVMIRQLAKPIPEKLQSSFMIILRHLVEDNDTILQTMKTEIQTAFESPRSSRNGWDTTLYARNLHHLILRQPDLFVQATKEMVEVVNYSGQPGRPQHLALKRSSPEHSQGDQAMAESKSHNFSNSDNIVQFLLRELSNFRDVEDKPAAKTSNEAVSTDDADPSAESTQATKNEEALFHSKDNVIYIYRCFLMQCLAETLGSYTQTKLEFMCFSRKPDPTPATPSKPRSGMLNYLLNQLLPMGTLEHRETVEHRKRAATSEWATALLTALCCQTFETRYQERPVRQPQLDDEDENLTVVRRFVLEHAIRSFKEALASSEHTDVRYSRLLALADLFERMLNPKLERTNPAHTSHFLKQAAQIGRIMYEKNFVGVLTSAIADLDLNFPNAKRAVKHILGPLKTLTDLAVDLSQQGVLSTIHQSTEVDEEEVSTAGSLTDEQSVDDEREQTPDLFRNSTLGMYEASGAHDDDEVSEEEEDDMEEDDDEEMYEAGFDEEMDYENDDNGETISDDDDDEELEGIDEEMGDIEGLPGDVQMELEIVEGDSQDEESSADTDSDDEDEDEDEDHGDYYDNMEEVNGDDENASLDEAHEGVWEEQADYDEQEGDDLVIDDGDALDQIAQIIGADDSALDPHGGFVGVAPDNDGAFFQDEMAGDGEDDDDDGEEEFEVEFGYEPELEEDDEDDAWGFEAGHYHGHMRRHRSHLHEDIFDLMGHRQPLGLGRFHRTHHHHHGPRAEDEGINPLLQRNDSAARDVAPYGGLPLFPPPIARIGGAPRAADIQALINNLSRDMIGPVLRNSELFNHAGHLTLTVDNTNGPRGLQLPFSRHFDQDFAYAGGGSHDIPVHHHSRHANSDEAHAVEFRLASTVTRWTEEAKILFSSRATEKATRIVNAILRALVPAAMEAKRKHDEEERQAAEERAKEAAIQAEKEQREHDEAERKRKEEEEAARLVAEAEAARAAEAAQAEDVDAPMDSDNAEQASTGASETVTAPAAPRVTVVMRGQEVDITSLGIDLDYLQALPEEFREEVIMSQYAEQRSQAQQAGEAPDQINREFLEALPEDIQRELIRSENAERRRREAREARRAGAEAGAAAIAQAQDMDPGDFLATLDPALRNQILLDFNDDQAIFNNLPMDIQRETRAIIRDSRPQRAGNPLPRLVEMTGQQQQQQQEEPEKVRVRPVVQMLDKAGIATLLRLMFITLHQTAKSSLRGILADICKNTQNRAEVISILLSILQDGTADVSAVERSFAQLSLRARQAGGPKTPQPLKRSLTGNLVQPVTELSPLNVVHQCLSTLASLSQDNQKVQTFFLSEHETLASSKTKSSKKGKGKESTASRYPLNALLTLLDRKLITENTGVMEILAGLLSRVTQPLQILAKKAKQAEDAAAVDKGNKEEQVEAPAAGDQMDISVADLREQPSVQTETTEKKKKSQRELEPPDVPEENVRLVINILAARECPSKTFSDTLDIIKHMSAIPGAKAIFGRELIRQASELGGDVVTDLDDLTQQIDKAQNGADVQAVALVSFSSAGSKQRKLLRILVALDHLFDAKRMAVAQPNSASADVKLKDDILASLYESDTFQNLWKNLSLCLTAIRKRGDLLNVATVLLPLIESLMVVCRNSALRDAAVSASQGEMTVSTPPPEARIERLFFNFTEEHRKILNELIRNNPKLMNGNLSILAKNSKVLEFDNKRSYFNRKLHNRGSESRGQHPVLTLNVRRDEVFMDSYKALFFKSGEEIKNGKLNIRFNGEEGVDAGGVSREWFAVMARQMFNPDFALFNPVASDRTTFHPNRLSDINEEHLAFFKFIGRVIGKALYENRVLDCHFSRAVYRRILGKSVSLKDMESLDLDYYKSLVWILENDITDITFETFSVEVDRFGEIEVVDLIPDGRNIAVTEDNKQEYVRLVVEHRLIESVKDQLNSFLGGFHEIIPAELVAIFNEQELELLISGLPEIDVDDWRNNTEYHNYQTNSAQIQWFWRAVKSFDPEERAKLLQFVTGTSKVPLNGFKELEGMNGFARFNIHRDYSSKEKLPTSHTCFNQLDLPEYESYEYLRQQLYTAITAGSEYFGFA